MSLFKKLFPDTHEPKQTTHPLEADPQAYVDDLKKKLDLKRHGFHSHLEERHRQLNNYSQSIEGVRVGHIFENIDQYLGKGSIGIAAKTLVIFLLAFFGKNLPQEYVQILKMNPTDAEKALARIDDSHTKEQISRMLQYTRHEALLCGNNTDEETKIQSTIELYKQNIKSIKATIEEIQNFLRQTEFIKPEQLETSLKQDFTFSVPVSEYNIFDMHYQNIVRAELTAYENYKQKEIDSYRDFYMQTNTGLQKKKGELELILSRFENEVKTLESKIEKIQQQNHDKKNSLKREEDILKKKEELQKAIQEIQVKRHVLKHENKQTPQPKNKSDYNDFYNKSSYLRNELSALTDKIGAISKVSDENRLSPQKIKKDHEKLYPLYIPKHNGVYAQYFEEQMKHLEQIAIEINDTHINILAQTINTLDKEVTYIESDQYLKDLPRSQKGELYAAIEAMNLQHQRKILVLKKKKELGTLVVQHAQKEKTKMRITLHSKMIRHPDTLKNYSNISMYDFRHRMHESKSKINALIGTINESLDVINKALNNTLTIDNQIAKIITESKIYKIIHTDIKTNNDTATMGYDCIFEPYKKITPAALIAQLGVDLMGYSVHIHQYNQRPFLVLTVEIYHPEISNGTITLSKVGYLNTIEPLSIEQVLMIANSDGNAQKFYNALPKP